MKAENFDIVGSYNEQRVLSIDAERSINMFEYSDPLGKKDKTLINTSGLLDSELVFPSASGGFRQQFVYTNGVGTAIPNSTDEYHVIGGHAYKITAAGVVVLLGAIVDSENYVGIDANTYQIIFVDGVHGYIWDTIANTFEQITDPSFPGMPIDCCMLDGFFVVINGSTANFQLSGLNQGLIWGPDNAGTESTFTMAAGASDIVITFAAGGAFTNYQVGTPVVFTGGSLPAELVAGTTYYVLTNNGVDTITVAATTGGTVITSVAGGSGSITNGGQLQQASITTHPGTIVACRTLHRRLFLFSQFFCEVWENAGIGTNLPFRRNNSLLMEYGTPCIGSISVSFDMMMFLSQTRDGLGPVMQVGGTQAIPISTRALDFQLAQYAADDAISDCKGFLIKENGLIFYRMNFTDANHTWVYNVTLSDPTQEIHKKWHEEEVLNGDRHPAQTHAYFNGKNYVGDYQSPIMYVVSSDVFTNNGEAIRRARIWRPFVPEGYERRRVDRLQIDLLQGSLDAIDDITEDIDLLAENGFILETENGLDILLEQTMIIGQPGRPFVWLSLSKDGGQTYGYRQRAPMGLIGDRTYRTLWRKLGVTPRGQAFVGKIEFYDAIPFVVLGGSWVYEVLPE